MTTGTTTTTAANNNNISSYYHINSNIIIIIILQDGGEQMSVDFALIFKEVKSVGHKRLTPSDVKEKIKFLSLT